jgi:hypothetical protein
VYLEVSRGQDEGPPVQPKTVINSCCCASNLSPRRAGSRLLLVHAKCRFVRLQPQGIVQGLESRMTKSSRQHVVNSKQN